MARTDDQAAEYSKELANVSHSASRFLSAGPNDPELPALVERVLSANAAAAAASPTLARYRETLNRMGSPPATTAVLPQFAYCIQSD